MTHLPDRQEELRRCYDEQATHFVETRKKTRPEFTYIKEHVQHIVTEHGGKPLQIAELGCGGGRLYSALSDLLPKKSRYTGIDFAAGMIDQAKKVAPKATRLVDDMVSRLRNQPQESIDLVFGIASIQHIKGKQKRALFFADAYRALTRGGTMILTNRSYSHWFLKKYRKQIAMTFPNILLDPALTRNDVLIPRKDHKDPTQQHSRYYHLFSLYELEQLARHAGFVVRTCSYVDQDGNLTDDRKNARNSFLVVQKEVR